MDLLAHNGIEHGTSLEGLMHFVSANIFTLAVSLGIFVLIMKLATKRFAKQEVTVKRRGDR